MPRPTSPSPVLWLHRFRELLALPVSAASLAAFRFAVGVVMMLEAYSLCVPDRAAISSGLSPLENYYTGSHIVLHFPFTAFSWVPMLGRSAVHGIVGAMAVGGLLVSLGLFYRFGAVVQFLSWGYLFAVESTRTYWQSHYYLELLVTFLLIWMPAADGYSLDAWLRSRRNGAQPGLPAIPFWPVFLLRGQLVIAYFYAGVAKITEDWMLDAMPVRYFLGEPGVLAPFRRILPESVFPAFQSLVESTAFAFFLCYVGLVFDLAIGFLFLFRRTRFLSMVLMAVFHATNHTLIFDDIGWFPLLGVLTSTIFLDTDWPLRVRLWLSKPRFRAPDWPWFWKGVVLLPGVGAALGWKPTAPPRDGLSRVAPVGSAVVVGVLAWLTFQTATPLRHYFIPGDGRFTYEGMSFSWRLKAEVRRAFSPQWVLEDPTVLVRDSAGYPTVDWARWNGDRIQYRELNPGRIDWRVLPEIVVLLEPYVGERILFNPFPSRSRTPAEALSRLGTLWTGIHSHPPASAAPVENLPAALRRLSEAQLGTGNSVEAEATRRLAEQAEQLESNRLRPEEADSAQQAIGNFLNAVGGSREARTALRRLPPMMLQGQLDVGAPFLVVEDPSVATRSASGAGQVVRSAWRSGTGTADRFRPNPDGVLVIYMADIGMEAREFLPRVYAVDSQDRPTSGTLIRWNHYRELTGSQILHCSFQPFFLRRYALHVAEQWQREHGRRPAVHAFTQVSLNGRPHSPLVDPKADLAGVPLSLFGHNPWIRDLPPGRIPKSGIAPGRIP